MAECWSALAGSSIQTCNAAGLYDGMIAVLLSLAVYFRSVALCGSAQKNKVQRVNDFAYMGRANVILQATMQGMPAHQCFGKEVCGHSRKDYRLAAALSEGKYHLLPNFLSSLAT